MGERKRGKSLPSKKGTIATAAGHTGASLVPPPKKGPSGASSIAGIRAQLSHISTGRVFLPQLSFQLG